MSAKERLQSAQSALQLRGVRDVKFCFAPGVTAMPLSEVQSRVVDFLDSYQKGRTKVVQRVGDAPIAA
jgi:hypothetical protein